MSVAGYRSEVGNSFGWERLRRDFDGISRVTPRCSPICEELVKESIPLESKEEISLINGMNAPDPPAENPVAKAPTEFRWWRVLLVTGLILVPLYFLTFPRIIRCGGDPRASEVIGNCRAIYGALWDFMTKHGRLPSPETIEEVKESTGTSIPLGTASSNDYLRQLIAAGADEKMFYSGSKKFRRPDGRVDGKHALEKGECGFAYVVGIGMSDNSSMPVLIGPVIPGQKRFDSEAFNKKAVMLRLDGSATMMTINIHGHIALGGGKSIDPAKPEWEGKPITIAWPE